MANKYEKRDCKVYRFQGEIEVNKRLKLLKDSIEENNNLNSELKAEIEEIKSKR